MHDAGPAAVYAGPGSGKTRVVTQRAARLAEHGARVLVTTFTNDATEEMRFRIAPLLPKNARAHAHVTTLHAFCLSVLRSLGRKFTLLTEEGQRKGLAEAAQAHELDCGLSGFITRTSYLKNTGQACLSYRPDGSSEDHLFATTWKSFEKAKKERGLLEFDDLLLEVMELFSCDEEVRKSWASRYTHVLVDECQDMNRPQFSIALALGRDHHNVMFVGDPDQSLYAFRGADSETFSRFASHPATTVYELRENYRSTRSIIGFGDSLIRQDGSRRPIPFIPTRDEGSPVRWEIYADVEVEALAIGEEILRQAEAGARWKDFAVLFRFNAQAEPLERNFAALGIPYTTKQTGDFYSRKEVAGLLAYLEFFCSLADEWLLRFLNAPNRRLARSVGTEMARIASIRGQTIWDSLPQFIAPDIKSHSAIQRLRTDVEHVIGMLPRAQHAGEVIRWVRQTMEFDSWLRTDEVNSKDNDRIQNLQQMEDAASHYGKLEDYLTAVRRVREEAERRKSEARKKRAEEDRVTLCTGHAAKGLEWRTVYAVGWSEQLLPHRKAEEIDEERRIAYVIATRARDFLAISSIQNWNGATVEPSRFLTGLQLRGGVAPPEHRAGVAAAEPDLGGLFVG
jgi:superfamily I DNA/RNA helicase